MFSDFVLSVISFTFFYFSNLDVFSLLILVDVLGNCEVQFSVSLMSCKRKKESLWCPIVLIWLKYMLNNFLAIRSHIWRVLRVLRSILIGFWEDVFRNTFFPPTKPLNWVYKQVVVSSWGMHEKLIISFMQWICLI